MTLRVRSGYRNHRKASWGLVLGLTLLVAAVVIPLATGAADKNYTMLFPSTSAATPPAASGSSTTQSLCTSTTYAIRLQIKNTAKTVSLGSADVSFPTGVGSLSGATLVPGGNQASGSTISRSGNVVSLRGLTLPKNGIVTFSVSLATVSSTVGASSISATVKQSNDFNDSSGTANLFDNPTFPTLAVQNCDVTISGRVYHDRDESGSFTTNPGSPATNDVVKSGWTVTLQRNDSGTYTTVDTDPSDGSGNYSVTGQIGRSYRVCVTAPSSPPDDGTPWGLRAVDGVTLAAGCTPISSASGSSSAGIGITSITANKTGQDFAIVPITPNDVAPGDASGSGNYVVTAAGNSSKQVAQQYAQETWLDANGLPYYVFASINPCSTSCDQLYLLEDLKGTVNQSALSGAQVHLTYDDFAPFTNFVEMPYCLQDPRLGGTDLRAPNVVLPSGASSCIVSGTQTANGDGTASNAKVDFEFFVYTAVDGSRGVT